MIGQSWYEGKLTLKEFREKYNLSQREVAREIGVAHSYISKLEAGEIRDLRLTINQFRNFMSLLNRYNLSIDDLDLN